MNSRLSRNRFLPMLAAALVLNGCNGSSSGDSSNSATGSAPSSNVLLQKHANSGSQNTESSTPIPDGEYYFSDFTCGETPIKLSTLAKLLRENSSTTQDNTTGTQESTTGAETPPEVFDNHFNTLKMGVLFTISQTTLSIKLQDAIRDLLQSTTNGTPPDSTSQNTALQALFTPTPLSSLRYLGSSTVNFLVNPQVIESLFETIQSLQSQTTSNSTSSTSLSGVAPSPTAAPFSATDQVSTDKGPADNSAENKNSEEKQWLLEKIDLFSSIGFNYSLKNNDLTLNLGTFGSHYLCPIKLNTPGNLTIVLKQTSTSESIPNAPNPIASAFNLLSKIPGSTPTTTTPTPEPSATKSGVADVATDPKATSTPEFSKNPLPAEPNPIASTLDLLSKIPGSTPTTATPIPSATKGNALDVAIDPKAPPSQSFSKYPYSMTPDPSSSKYPYSVTPDPSSSKYPSSPGPNPSDSPPAPAPTSPDSTPTPYSTPDVTNDSTPTP